MATRYLTDIGDLQYKYINLPLADYQVGAVPPTVATKGTTPTVTGWLFDAANELMQLQFSIPDDWETGSDILVELVCVLNQAETNNDDIDWSCDYISATPGSDGATKASTAITGTTDIGTQSADGDIHEVELTLVHDNANNPLSIGDAVILEIHRTDLANCGGVIVINAYVKYNPRF